MLKLTVIPVLALGAVLIRAQDDPAARKAQQEKMAELRKTLGSGNEGEKLNAIQALGELRDDEATSLLAGKLTNEGDAIRIAAAKAIARHRKPASVRAIAGALGANAARPPVLKAFVEALQELDLCSCIPVLVTIAPLNKYTLAEDAFKAIGKIGCSEAAATLLPFLQRAEIEEKKPDQFEAYEDYGDGSENKQKNKALAALAPKLRDLLNTVTGKSFANSREWAAALSSGSVPSKRTSVYFCKVKGETFEVASGQSKKCPYDAGKSVHEDIFLKHLKE